MASFNKLFGVEASEVKDLCLIIPGLNKEILDLLKIKNIKRGKLYGCGNAADFTLIHTGMGAGFVGDAVLYLKETACQYIFLFGSCGSLGTLDIGRLVLSEKCYSQESFSETLLGKSREPILFYPDRKLFDEFLLFQQSSAIEKVSCCTISSLKLEEERLEELKNRGIDVVDMECSAFFSAANFIGRPAMALFYVSDVVEKKPFYEPLTLEDKTEIRVAIKNAASILTSFAYKWRCYR